MTSSRQTDGDDGNEKQQQQAVARPVPQFMLSINEEEEQEDSKDRMEGSKEMMKEGSKEETEEGRKEVLADNLGRKLTIYDDDNSDEK